MSSESELRAWQDRVNGWHGASEGSALSSDDAAWTPFPLSAVVLNKLATTVDHLLAVRALADGPLHPLAPFTLLRTALLASSQAVWLLDTNAEQRQARAAHSAVEFGQNYRTYMRDARKAGHLEYRAAAMVLGRILLRHAGLERLRASLPKAKPTDDTGIIRAAAVSVIEASQSSESDKVRWPHQVVSFWRNMSGDVHSSPWAAMARRTMDAAEASKQAGTIQAFGIAPEPQVVGAYFHVVLVTARHAWKLLDSLNVPPAPVDSEEDSRADP